MTADEYWTASQARKHLAAEFARPVKRDAFNSAIHRARAQEIDPALPKEQWIDASRALYDPEILRSIWASMRPLTTTREPKPVREQGRPPHPAWEEAEKIRALYEDGTPLTALAKQYSASHTTLRKIIHDDPQTPQ